MAGAQFKQNPCEFVKLRGWELLESLGYSDPGSIRQTGSP